MPTQPSERAIGGTLTAVTSGFANVIGSACASGDLLLLIAAKRAASNFTFPAGFTKQTEQVTSGMVSAIGWKWGALADSGATFVCSTSGLGNLLHAMTFAFKNVQSTATPLKGYIAEVRSSNIARCGSLTLGAANPLGVHIHPAFDNVFPTATGYTASSWSIVSSLSTATGSDGAIVVAERSFTFANSGNQINPNSTAVAVDQRRHYYTFFLDGPPATFAPTASDDVDAFTDNLSDGVLDYAFYWRQQDDAHSVTDEDVSGAELNRLHSDSHAVTDDVSRFRECIATLTDNLGVADAGENIWLTLMATEVVTLLDSVDATYIPGGGGGPTVVVKDDFLVLSDDVFRVRIAMSDVADVLTIADSFQVSRLVGIVTADGTSLIDAALTYSLRNASISDDSIISDASGTQAFRNRQHDDTTVIADGSLLALAYLRTTGDSFDLLDDVQRAALFTQQASDDVSFTDAAISTALRGALTSDGVIVIDATDSATLRQSITQDAITLSDEGVAQRILFRLFEDTHTVSDAVASAVLWNRLAGDSIELIDSVLSAVSGFNLTIVTDGVELSDGVQRVLLTWRVVTDGFALADDVISAKLGNQLITASDVLVVDDSSTLQAIRNRDMIDAILGIADAAVIERLRNLVLDESVLPSDNAFTDLRRLLLLSDSLDVTDGVARIGLFGRDMIDLLQITDGFDAQYLSGIASQFVLRVRVGLDDQVILGADFVAAIGADESPLLGDHDLITLDHDDFRIDLGGFN